jgi:prolipoprotein diacylglyceryl transferase
MVLNYINWNVDPELVNLFGISIRYYGLLFIGGIFPCILILNRIFKEEKIPQEKLSSLTIYVMIGIFAGGRIGHCLFYEASYYLSHPFEMILPIAPTEEGGYKFSGFHGMASHGAVMGLIIALIFYSKKNKIPVIKIIDLIAIVTPLEGFFIRMANLMNSEIIGIPTDVSWAFIFKRVDNVPRHPTQLYEAITYLLIFGLIIYLYKIKRDKLQNGVFFGMSVTLVFIARFFIEFLKETQVSFEEQMNLDMGQWLSIPFIIAGAAFIIYGLNKTKKDKLAMAKNNKIMPKTKQGKKNSK